MTAFVVCEYSLPHAYHDALETLHEEGKIVDCPAWGTRCKEISLVMNVEKPFMEPRISRVMPGGPRDLEKYRLEMLDGIEEFEVARGNWPYTYHQRIAAQLPGVIAELRRDPHSRRACVTVRLPEDIYMEDPPCLQHLQFIIRDGELHMTALFRSNDAMKATFMNAFALICLQERMAKELGVDVGSYTHIANSFHVYEKDWGALKLFYYRWCIGDSLTYRYAGEWDELMEAERAGILREVEKRKCEKGEAHEADTV